MPMHRWQDIRAGKFSPEKLAEVDSRVAVALLPFHIADAGRAAYFEGDPHEVDNDDIEEVDVTQPGHLTPFLAACARERPIS